MRPSRGAKASEGQCQRTKTRAESRNRSAHARTEDSTAASRRWRTEEVERRGDVEGEEAAEEAGPGFAERARLQGGSRWLGHVHRTRCASYNRQTWLLHDREVSQQHDSSMTAVRALSQSHHTCNS